jgi:hypothetical protein
MTNKGEVAILPRKDYEALATKAQEADEDFGAARLVVRARREIAAGMPLIPKEIVDRIAGGENALSDQQTDQLLALMKEEKQNAAARGESVYSAGQDQANPPAASRIAPYKSHLAYVKERRSETDGQAILDEALSSLRDRGLIH